MKFLILTFSVLCLVVFRAAFDTFWFFYGAEWWEQYKKTLEADKLNAKLEGQRKIKQLEASIPIECEVEDMGRVVEFDNVKYKRDHKEEIISFELEIVSNGNS